MDECDDSAISQSMSIESHGMHKFAIHLTQKTQAETPKIIRMTLTFGLDH